MRQLIVFLFCSISVFSQKTTEIFVSNILGEDREIAIGLPESYDKNQTKKYPIVVLLDGDYLFDIFNGVINYGAYWDDFPETIIVGISQKKKQERIDDCTYGDDGLPSKKGASFFEFIGGELLPYIEKKYRIAPFRIIAGHGLTAGFSNYFLFKDYSIFNAFISLSPELIPKMETQIPDRFTALKQPLFYYQSTADNDVDEILQTVNLLDLNIQAAKNPLINYKYDVLENVTHYSSVIYAIPNALYQIFDCYQPISKSEFSEKIATITNGQVKYLIDKYENIAKTLGLKVQIRYSDFTAIEASILANKSYTELEKLSDLARKNHPKTMLADYELALMYEKLGDFKKAAKAYHKASDLNPIGTLNTNTMLDKYEEMQSLTPTK